VMDGRARVHALPRFFPGVQYLPASLVYIDR
jgi:hypothetical protein